MYWVYGRRNLHHSPIPQMCILCMHRFIHASDATARIANATTCISHPWVNEFIKTSIEELPMTYREIRDLSFSLYCEIPSPAAPPLFVKEQLEILRMTIAWKVLRVKLMCRRYIQKYTTHEVPIFDSYADIMVFLQEVIPNMSYADLNPLIDVYKHPFIRRSRRWDLSRAKDHIAGLYRLWIPLRQIFLTIGKMSTSDYLTIAAEAIPIMMLATGDGYDGHTSYLPNMAEILLRDIDTLESRLSQKKIDSL